MPDNITILGIMRNIAISGGIYQSDDFLPISLLRLLRQLSRGLDHVVEELFEILQAGGGYDDGVTAAANVFRNAQKTATRVFLEGEQKGFAFDLNLVGFQSILVDRRLGLPIRTPPIWRWPFV